MTQEKTLYRFETTVKELLKHTQTIYTTDLTIDYNLSKHLLKCRKLVNKLNRYINELGY